MEDGVLGERIRFRMKPSYEWNEQAILQLIADRVEESIQLEYKGSASLQSTDEKKKEMSKDISAFANSNGGTIIYGVAEFDEKTKRHLPEKIDGGYDPSDISKEWLEQVISSRIHPRIEGLRINPIQLDKPELGKVIYVIYIPESYTAHQASDHRYYKRFNFQSIPMEDYEVRLVMNKIRYPLLVPDFKFDTVTRTETIHVYRLMIELENKGMVRAIDIQFELWLPNEIRIIASKGPSLKYSGMKTIESRAHRHYIIELFGSDRIIFPKQKFSLLESSIGTIHYHFDTEVFQMRHNLKLFWKLYAGDAPLQEGEVPFEKLNDF